jgi:alginate O-acetyltransferase complex protein AlgI
MLFSSYEFILGFLPATLLGFILTRKIFGQTTSQAWLIGASIIFYLSWGVNSAFFLVASIMFNYWSGRTISKTRADERTSFYLLVFAITSNLLMLGYFKYTNFSIDNLNIFLGLSIPKINIVLPVGISFFTFSQILYLIGIYSGRSHHHNFLKYVLFATFFPYVTAGPIVVDREVFPQYHRQKFQLENLVIGLSIFAIGLFKKLVFADGIAPYADSIFNSAQVNIIGTTDAWLGAIAYTFQIYFDFSGYSDMAIGLGCMFGIKLPLNFNSPYKAVSITDFWRRWHMTMTRFFTTVIFSPVAVKLTRYSLLKSYSPGLTFSLGVALPTILTLTLAGLWHGAGWNFIIFGVLHGVALAINQIWDEVRLPPPPQSVGWLLTMGIVIVGLVLFRAPNLATAQNILQSTMGLSEIAGTAIPAIISRSKVLPALAILAGVTLLAPNTQELMRYFSITTDAVELENSSCPHWLAWKPTIPWALFCTSLFIAAIFSVKGNTSFLYYQF